MIHYYVFDRDGFKIQWHESFQAAEEHAARIGGYVTDVLLQPCRSADFRDPARPWLPRL